VISRFTGRRISSPFRQAVPYNLAQLGYVVAATATRVEKAVEVAASSDFDCAILDVDLDGYSVSFVADTLVARGMPFLFATGHGQAGLPEHHRDRPLLQKPFRIESLGRILEQVLAAKETLHY
jgi:DNA-binding NtrC family response regulator